MDPTLFLFKVIKNNAVTDQEKREKKIVVKKLAEMEEELKVGLKLKSISIRIDGKVWIST